MIQRRQIAFSFDTTGSMRPCMIQVRKSITSLVHEMKAIDAGVEIAIILHGDYCDSQHPYSYLTRVLDFTDDASAIERFLASDNGTNGGDCAECYEYVLMKVRDLSWATADSTKRIVLMFGDDIPHAPTEVLKWRSVGHSTPIDWRTEVDALAKRNISVYGIQCLNNRYATTFWKAISESSGGWHMDLHQFADAASFIMAVFLKQQDDAGASLKAFGENLQSHGRLNRNVAQTIQGLSDGTFKPDSAYTESSGKLIPVSAGRFQVMTIEHDQSIQGFVESNGVPYIAGRGFYQFKKRETIQERKEVIVQNRTTGDLFTGDAARELIGVPRGTRADVKPSAEIVDKFNIFVQSTSYNRKLRGGDLFLYEVDKTR